MSFHGGLARRRSSPPFSSRCAATSRRCRCSTFCAAVTPIGLFFGRVANFINGELWGRPSDVPWAMVFPAGGPLPRHPSQLYEAALEGVLLFLVLLVLTHASAACAGPASTGGAFIGGYGACRFFVEFFREPDAQLGFISGFLTMGMLLSLPMLAHRPRG